MVLTGGGATFPIAEGEKLDTCWEVGVLTRGGAILSSSDFCLALYPAIAEGKKLYSCWEEGLLTEGGIMLLVSGVCLFWLSAIADEGNLHTFWEGEGRELTTIICKTVFRGFLMMNYWGLAIYRERGPITCHSGGSAHTF